MDKEKITPEEKLLKIIENPDSVEKRKPDPKEEITKGLNSILGRYKNLRFDMKMLKSIDVQMVIKAIGAVCAVLTIFLLYDLIKNSVYFNNKFGRITAEPAISGMETRKLMNIDVKMSDVLSQAKKRNMFTLIPPKPVVLDRADISRAPVELKLVGVLWSDNPQAMIENTAEQKTYFVNQGDMIGSVKVKTILQNKVVLSKDSEEWDLQ